MSRHYPMFFDVQDRLCVVVGGGTPALGRVEGLRHAGAVVRVIAPELTAALASLVTDGSIEHVARTYRDGDLEGATLAFSERLDDPTHRAIHTEARARNVPLNVEDVVPYCSFIVPAVVRRDDLVVAISTGGAAPALAVRIKERMQRFLGPHHGRFLQLARRLRSPLLARHPDFGTRKSLWYRLVDSDVLHLLERGDESSARRRIVEICGVAPTPEVEVGP